MIERDTAQNTIRLRSHSCTFIIERLAGGVLLVSIRGYDRGEFGSTVLDEVEIEISRHREPIMLFVDASGAEGVAWEVSRLWTDWFRTIREQLRRVHVLTHSRFVHLSIAVARQLSRTGEMITLYTDGDLFEAAVRREIPEWSGLIGLELV